MISTDNFFIDGTIGPLSVRSKGVDQEWPTVVLVQGSNLSGQSMFDLKVMEDDTYSMMEALAEGGFASVTFAVRGYSGSRAPVDPFDVTTEAAMEDLSAVIDWLASQGHGRPHLLGFSWGGRIAGRYAEGHGEKIDRLVLYDPARGGGALVLPAPTAEEGWWTNTEAHYLEKLEPEFTPLALRKALGRQVADFESRSPNGIRLENATPVKEIDASRITRPTLLIYGCEAAKAPYMHGGATRQDFFETLNTNDKAFVILPDGGDFAHFQKARFRLYRELIHFLSARRPDHVA